MELRSELLSKIASIDEQIIQVIDSRRTKKAFDQAKNLFAERSRIVDELSEYGLHIGQHPAVIEHLSKDH